MPQLNLDLTPDFEESLCRFMQLRKISTQSEAVRIAVREGLERAVRNSSGRDFRSWLGLGKRVAENPNPHFKSDDDLWG
jgi:hypothetical protein